MSINKKREARRKDISKMETNNMLNRYQFECGEVITRNPTLEEMNKKGRRTSEKEHNDFLRNSLYTY